MVTKPETLHENKRKMKKTFGFCLGEPTMNYQENWGPPRGISTVVWAVSTVARASSTMVLGYSNRVLGCFNRVFLVLCPAGGVELKNHRKSKKSENWKCFRNTVKLQISAKSTNTLKTINTSKIVKNEQNMIFKRFLARMAPVACFVCSYFSRPPTRLPLHPTSPLRSNPIHQPHHSSSTQPHKCLFTHLHISACSHRQDWR